MAHSVQLQMIHELQESIAKLIYTPEHRILDLGYTLTVSGGIHIRTLYNC